MRSRSAMIGALVVLGLMSPAGLITPVMSNDVGQKVAGPSARQKTFDLLIASNWCDQQRGAVGLGDYSSWDFRLDGTYRYHEFTDHDHGPQAEGQWRLEETAHGWVLAFDTGERHQLEVHPNGRISIEWVPLRPCRPTHATTRDVTSLPPLELPARVRALRDALVQGPWTHANDLDLAWSPTSIRFESDWTYTSTYRYGACKNTGSWSLRGSEVQGYAARNACDERNPHYSENPAGQLLSNDQILIRGELYVLTPTPSRGVIWRLLGRQDAVDVRVEYPIPLRQGKPASFTFTFHSVSGEPATLERVALNRVYRDYRHGTRGMDTPEIAARDLGRRQLPPGESWSVDLEAVFDRAAEQNVYFQVLISGSPQNWDVRQVRRVTVRP